MGIVEIRGVILPYRSASRNIGRSTSAAQITPVRIGSTHVSGCRELLHRNDFCRNRIRYAYAATHRFGSFDPASAVPPKSVDGSKIVIIVDDVRAGSSQTLNIPSSQICAMVLQRWQTMFWHRCYSDHDTALRRAAFEKNGFLISRSILIFFGSFRLFKSQLHMKRRGFL